MKKKIEIVSDISHMQASFVRCTRFLIMFFLLGVFLAGTMEPVLAQTTGIKISGMVKDEAGVPLPGVSVVVKGTTVGTITSSEGKFNFESSQVKGVLAFSFIGCKQKSCHSMDRETTMLS